MLVRPLTSVPWKPAPLRFRPPEPLPHGARLGPASLCVVPTHHAHLGFPLSSSQLILYQAAESGPAFLPHLPSRLSPRPATLEPHCPLSPLDRAARVPASGPAHWPWPAALLPPVVGRRGGWGFPRRPHPSPSSCLSRVWRPLSCLSPRVSPLCARSQPDPPYLSRTFTLITSSRSYK